MLSQTLGRTTSVQRSLNQLLNSQQQYINLKKEYQNIHDQAFDPESSNGEFEINDNFYQTTEARIICSGLGVLFQHLDQLMSPERSAVDVLTDQVNFMRISHKDALDAIDHLVAKTLEVSKASLAKVLAEVQKVNLADLAVDFRGDFQRLRNLVYGVRNFFEDIAKEIVKP